MHVDGSSRSKGTWQKALEACRYCVSDEAGRFEVVGAGQAEDGVLWATAPGYEATFEWVRSEFEGVKTLRFTKERALEAQVIHGGAGNLGGAVLIQRGYVPNAGPWSELSAESQARHLLIRQHVLPDGAGSRALVELPPLPSPTVAWCEQDDLASEERALDLETTFDLTLRPTFILDVQVEGDVPFPDARMRVLVDEAATARPLGVIRLGVDGVGGGRLPVVNGGQLTAFLIGEGVPLSTKTFDSPDPGGQVALTFGSEGAESITWRFLDPGGEPVSEVSASLGWDDVDGAWIQVPTITISDEDGLAHTPLPAAGEVWLGYLHQDYLADFSGPFEPASLPRGDDGLLLPVEFTLTPKARLTGRVRGGGEYLLEYKLYGWEAGEPASNQLELDYTIGENGIFLMERQAGPIYLSATAEGYAQSSSVQVAAPKGLSDEILIEVQEPLLGRGRVLDALTLEPIPGAQVWIGVTEFGNVYAWMPDALVTDSNGSFEARAFSSDQLSNAWVDAEGYASVSGLGEVDMAGVASEVNFGDVLLERASWTDIEVHGLGEEDKAWIQVEGGSDWIEMAAHGEVWTYRLEGQVGGRLSYGVANDDGTLWASRLLYQSGRGPWKDVVHLGGTTSLQLSLGDLGMGKEQANLTWILVLFGYSAIASLLPVWLLLQPRDYVNSHQLVVGLDAFFGEHAPQRGGGPQVEQGLHFGLRRPGAHETSLAPSAENEGERGDQDALSRARLPGDDVETRAQLELGVLDDGQITDAEQTQGHGISTRSDLALSRRGDAIRRDLLSSGQFMSLTSQICPELYSGVAGCHWLASPGPQRTGLSTSSSSLSGRARGAMHTRASTLSPGSDSRPAGKTTVISSGWSWLTSPPSCRLTSVSSSRSMVKRSMTTVRTPVFSTSKSRQVMLEVIQVE